MPGGRPSELTPEVLEQANAYLKEWESEGDMIPSVEALAGHLKKARKTLYNWGDSNGEFLHILEEVNRLQAKTLINKGLSGDFNSNITKLVLGKHGYKEKQDVTSNDEALGGLFQVELVKAKKD